MRSNVDEKVGHDAATSDTGIGELDHEQVVLDATVIKSFKRKCDMVLLPVLTVAYLFK